MTLFGQRLVLVLVLTWVALLKTVEHWALQLAYWSIPNNPPSKHWVPSIHQHMLALEYHTIDKMFDNSGRQDNNLLGTMCTKSVASLPPRYHSNIRYRNQQQLRQRTRPNRFDNRKNFPALGFNI